MGHRVLFIDDEENLRFSYKAHLETAGYEVAVAADYNSALAHMPSFKPDLIIADIILGGRTGIDLLREVRQFGFKGPVIMITGQPDVTSAMEAVRLGAFDYLAKPFRKEMLFKIVNHALTQKKMAEEKERYRQNVAAVFQSLEDGIISMDHNLKVQEVNNALSRICRFSPKQVSGKSFSQLTPKCSQTCLEIIEQTQSMKKPMGERRIQCRCSDRPNQVVALRTALLKREAAKPDGVVLVVRDLTRLTDLERQLKERYKFHNLIGKSPKMQKVYSILEVLADTDTTVLIRGESGTGKELVAQALHQHGNRAGKPIVTVDCSALSESILESELFGHVKGAFTGAAGDKVGRFQLADGGTIFLDEIGNISNKIQRKILRFLQEKEFEKVGATNPVKVDVRIITATNMNLEDKVQRGEFREDIFYRLKVMEVFLPPLRERLEDIPLLVDHFIGKFNQKLNRQIHGVSKDVTDLFLSYPWPGNVRELEHALEHAFILCQDSIIAIHKLPANIKNFKYQNQKKTTTPADERQRLLQVLKEKDWNKAKAARELGINRRTIYRKIKRYKISPPPE